MAARACGRAALAFFIGRLIMLTVFYRVLDVFNVLVERVFLTCASLSLLAIMILVSFNALARYFLGGSIRGSFELSEYILLYFTFLSAPYLIRVNGHATFDIVITLVSERARKVMLLVSCLLGIVICAILTRYAFDVTVSNYQRNIVVQNNLMTPRYLLIGIIPVGGALMCTELLQKVLSILMGIEDRQDLSLTFKSQS